MDDRIPESFKILGINLAILTGSQPEKHKSLTTFFRLLNFVELSSPIILLKKISNFDQ
jgi:hypothetical protein